MLNFISPMFGGAVGPFWFMVMVLGIPAGGLIGWNITKPYEARNDYFGQNMQLLGFLCLIFGYFFPFPFIAVVTIDRIFIRKMDWSVFFGSKQEEPEEEKPFVQRRKK